MTIAAAHESSISTAELLQLLPEKSFESPLELERFLDIDSKLGQMLMVTAGEVTLKGLDQLVRRRPEQVRLSANRLQVAETFTNRLARLCPWIRLAAVSGSTAYAGTKDDDDIDFFVVTDLNRLWVTLLIAMVGARLGRLRNRNLPTFCFNRITEEDECRDAFNLAREPLFAREALNLRVLRGRRYYRELIDSAAWMAGLFPGRYRQALDSTPFLSEETNNRHGIFWSVANRVAMIILVPYTSLMSMWRNRRLERAGRIDARFRTVFRRGFFAYESIKYDLLRDAYKEAF